MKALDFLKSSSGTAVDFLQSPPTVPNDMASAHAPAMMPSHQPANVEPVKSALQQAASAVRPVIEGGGATAGGVIGAASPVPGGAFVGGVGGYAIAKKIADILEQWAGNKVPQPVMQEIIGSLGDLAEGAKYEMGGQIAGPLISKAAKPIGAAAEQLLGRMSGVGTGAIKESVRGGDAFTKAMRGAITGEEITSNAREALNVLKARRGADYQGQLQAISANSKELNVQPIINKTANLMKQYNVKVLPDGSIDTSRIAMGKSGRDDIVDVIQNVSKWGTEPGDKTAVGLDTLKRQLDDFYSDSSQARAFVADLRNTIKGVISSEVPEYGKMTAKYAEATKLIKDIESGLMLRKEGMTGRVVSDMTLRRLMSAMRDNFALRKELLETLGNQAGEDLSGQVAGYTMRSIAPVGLSGTGPAIVGQAAIATFNPKFWPVLAASSPRVQGEFLRYWGKALNEFKQLPEEVVRSTARQAMISKEQSQ